MIVNMRDYSNKNIPVILYLGDRCDRDEDTDIIVVNPTLSDELYETPMWKFDTVYALCSVSSWESYLETIRHDFQGIRLTETDVFNCEKNDDIVQLIALIERVLQYRESNILLHRASDWSMRRNPILRNRCLQPDNSPRGTTR